MYHVRLKKEFKSWGHARQEAYFVSWLYGRMFTIKDPRRYPVQEVYVLCSFVGSNEPLLLRLFDRKRIFAADYPDMCQTPVYLVDILEERETLRVQYHVQYDAADDDVYHGLPYIAPGTLVTLRPPDHPDCRLYVLADVTTISLRWVTLVDAETLEISRHSWAMYSGHSFPEAINELFIVEKVSTVLNDGESGDAAPRETPIRL